MNSLKNENKLIWNEILFEDFLEELFNLIELIQNKFNYKKLYTLIKYINKYYKTSNQFKEETKLSIEGDINLNIIFSGILYDIDVNRENNYTNRGINNNINKNFRFKDLTPQIQYLTKTIIENCFSLRL